MILRFLDQLLYFVIFIPKSKKIVHQWPMGKKHPVSIISIIMIHVKGQNYNYFQTCRANISYRTNVTEYFSSIWRVVCISIPAFILTFIFLDLLVVYSHNEYKLPDYWKPYLKSLSCFSNTLKQHKMLQLAMPQFLSSLDCAKKEKRFSGCIEAYWSVSMYRVYL